MTPARTHPDASPSDRIGVHHAAELADDPSAAAPEGIAQPPSALPLPQKKPRKPDRRRALTRRAIIDAAAELFTAQGVEATTIDDIAASAELSAGTLYFHFGSKENVLLALVSAVLDADGGHLPVADRSGSAVERLLEAGTAYFRFAMQQPVAFDFVVSGLPALADDAPGDAVEAREIIAHRLQAFAAAVTSDLQEAMDDGDIDAMPVDVALALVWSAWNGVVGLVRRRDEFAISEAFAERVLTHGRALMLGGLLGERRPE